MNPLDPQELKRQSHLVIDFLVDYYNNVENYPVRSRVRPGYLKQRIPKSAPLEPEPIEVILEDVKKDIIPGLTHWQSPNFFAFFPCTLSIPGFPGEMLCTGFNTPGFNWISSPAATELETAVVDWVGEMLQLPESFLFAGGGSGVIQGTTCEALLSVLVAARDRMLKRIGGDNINRLVVYGSDQTHCAFWKAAKIAGIHVDNFRAVAAGRDEAFALSAGALRAAAERDVREGLVPLFLCATVGTTASTAVDPVGELGEAAKELGMWLHVDGAHAASACICPEHGHFLDGVETADSFSFNPHKWLFTGLDCCFLWLKHPPSLLHSLSTNPEYLRTYDSLSNHVVDYKDWQISLTRRFRSMKVWLLLRSYGVANLRNLLRSRLKMGEDFEGLIRRDNQFELVVPRNFSTICFRISPLHFSDERMANDLNAKLLESINESGEVFMTHAVIGGAYVIRISIGGSLTQSKHIHRAWKVVQRHAQLLLPTTT